MEKIIAGLKERVIIGMFSSLIERIIEMGSDENSIVADFFAGSGTTGHAVLELNKEDGGNRQFILCTNNENNNGNGFRTLNIVGHTIDMCEDIGFIFKREIIWHKTNGVRANFGTYPYLKGF